MEPVFVQGGKQQLHSSQDTVAKYWIKKLGRSVSKIVGPLWVPVAVLSTRPPPEST